MKAKKKKKSTKNQEFVLVDIISDMLAIMKDSNGAFSKLMINNLISTFADVLKDNPAFREILADPKADITQFEPIIKKLLKKKK